MMTASCHCGALRMEIETDTPPETVLDCACSICRRKGGLWAYYAPHQVRVMPESGATFVYLWGDRMIEHHTCKTCGCTTHWTPVDKTYPRMGVNARMMEPEVLAAAAVRYSPGPD